VKNVYTSLPVHFTPPGVTTVLHGEFGPALITAYINFLILSFINFYLSFMQVLAFQPPTVCHEESKRCECWSCGDVAVTAPYDGLGVHGPHPLWKVWLPPLA
jgi:hypothetical protein